jgi:hypothetical protein
MSAELIICQHEQGSSEWLNARLGVITASQIHDLLPNARTKMFQYKEARQTYMYQLIGEVCTGYSEELNARALQWGKDNEDAAIAAYEFATGQEVEKTGLIYRDSTKRAACTPDAKIIGRKKYTENKCPITPKVHIDFVLGGNIKPEYISQCQFGMWVTGAEEWDFTSYHPRMKSKMVHFVTIERDPVMMEYFDNEIPKFIEEMDKELAKIGIPWGAQWN